MALLTRQGSNGSFGLWSAGGDDVWLDSYVTDFLTRARERKFAVPEAAFKLALDRLRNAAADLTDPGKNDGADLAYALYVLARNGAAPIGDLRYLADAKLDALKTPIAKAQIAAALAMVGDRARAERVYAAALAAIGPQPQPDLPSREDYGSTLRDAAALVTLAVRRRRQQRDGAGRGAAGRGRARVACVRPRRKKMPGSCLRQAPWPRTPAMSRSTSMARRSTAAQPHHQRGRSERRRCA